MALPYPIFVSPFQGLIPNLGRDKSTSLQHLNVTMFRCFFKKKSTDNGQQTTVLGFEFFNNVC